MFLWPRYEKRVFKVDRGTALEWPDRVRKCGVSIDDSPKWARIAAEFGDYYWASVVHGRARVGLGVDDAGKNPGCVSPFDLPGGLYLMIVFRVNDANNALADSVERALFGDNAKCVGRCVRRLGGRPRVVA